MQNNGWLTKIFAAAGTLLLWLPVVAPVMFSLIRFGQMLRQNGAALAFERFTLDYLMPAELFPAALVGGCLLLVAAAQARARRGLIGGGLAAALALLVGGQVLAVLSGLASGVHDPSGPLLWLVIFSLVAYTAAIAVAGTGGILLLRDLFAAQPGVQKA